MKKKLLFAFLYFSCQLTHAQWTTSSPNIYFNTGNVGIGTTTPGNKLEIGSTTSLDGIKLTYNSNGFVRLHPNSLFSGAYNNITQNGDAGIIFGGTSGTTCNYGFVIAPWSPTTGGIRIDQNGNVGIATANTQGYNLAVNGSAIFTSAFVKSYANWPDYVFNKEYHLPSLASVAKFIEINNHLPEMPSADSITRKGIDLGANQVLLLKKIEELTLYLIDQNKELELLKLQNRQLEERNKKRDKQNIELTTQMAKIKRLEKLVLQQSKNNHNK